jgi:hypothetical protein
MRADLLALTPETLAELTNRGLVKRAAREVDRDPPAIVESPDGTVEATQPDGTVTTLPTGGLEAAKCTCAAPGVCRHVVALVLTYQAGSSAPDADQAQPPRSPGAFTDDQLAARIGDRMMAAARRIERTGYVARVHRARPGDPVPTVELPTTTVRFLVPDDLGFARTDAVAGTRDDVLALAVWAFRVADEQAPDEPDVQVQVGGGGKQADASGAGLDRAVAFAGLVLREGAVHLGAGVAAEITAVRAELDQARMRWPLLAVDDLAAQLDAYRERSARYRPESLADHVAELFARHRTVTGGGAVLASRVLGTDEAAETPLRRARLDGLGARVTAAGGERFVDIFLAHADSATVLVLRRSYETDDDGPKLAERRVAGVTVGVLAGGAVVTESASRSASRTVRLGARRLSRTEAMVSRGSWQDLPRALIAADLAALAVELDALPPRPIRSRVAAELVRVVPVAEVHALSYAPGAQRLDAVITDPSGATAQVTATHASCAPGRLDGVAAALTSAELRFVAGPVRRGDGGLVIDPIGFAAGDGVLVPDLMPPTPGPTPRDRPAPMTDPLAQSLDEALSLLAEVAHQGLLHTPPTMPTRLRATADRLGTLGLRRAAEAVRAVAALLGPDPGPAAESAWVDAYLRVLLSAELHT